MRHYCAFIDEMTKMERELKHLLIAIGLGLLLGGLIVQRWHKLDFPESVVFVEITNTLNEVVPLVRIEHGSDFLQERILLTQFRPNETRLIRLNHELGKGYTIEAQLKNKEKIEACVGRYATQWVEHIEIGFSGIRSVD